MGTEVERNANPISSSTDEDLKELEADYAKLREETEQLIIERTELDSELRTVRKKAERLEENVNLLKMPPLIIGHLQDVSFSSFIISFPYCRARAIPRFRVAR